MKTSRARRWLRRLMLAAFTVGGALLAAGAARVYSGIPVREVVVDGASLADADEVVRLAGLPDSTALVDVDARLVADRVRRHPWVKDAQVRRLPTGTLRIDITERAPAALVVGEDGRPLRYLDSEGHELPLASGVGFDVPLLRGAVPAAANTRAVDDPHLVELLRALAGATPEVDALISEVIYRTGDVTLRTTPVTGHPSLTARLGGAPFAEKLERLRAFYDQSVLPRPGRAFQFVDLRFHGQVVTREPAPAPSPTAP